MSDTPVSADAALARLLAGNARFVAGRPEHPRQDAAHRRDLATGQHPIAAVLGCADSRVPPEIVFDQGVGDIFVLRVAGNVVDDAMLGSLEYAVEHLGVPLIVVLGHARCGAVAAALGGGAPPGHLPAVTEPIRPAIEATRGAPGDPVANVAVAHARAMAGRVRGVVRGARVVAAFYELESGDVSVLE